MTLEGRLKNLHLPRFCNGTKRVPVSYLTKRVIKVKILTQYVVKKNIFIKSTIIPRRFSNIIPIEILISIAVYFILPWTKRKVRQ